MSKGKYGTNGDENTMWGTTDDTSGYRDNRGKRYDTQEDLQDAENDKW